MDSFTELVHGLPREIFDRIKNLVFTARCGVVVVVDANYKPPHLLAVTKSTRQQYAESYYSEGTVFRFQEPKLLFKYLTSVSKQHRKLIKAIKLFVTPPSAEELHQRVQGNQPHYLPSIPLSLEDVEFSTKENVLWNLRRRGGLVDRDTLSIVYNPYEPEEFYWSTQAAIGLACWSRMFYL